METINKLGGFISLVENLHDSPEHERTDRLFHLGANTHCITSAEEKHLAEQDDVDGEVAAAAEHSITLNSDANPRISLAAG